MTFSKFISIIETKRLFVPFASLLPDQYEGVPYHDEYIKHFIALEKILNKEGVIAKLPSVGAIQQNKEARKFARLTAISCWTKSGSEESFLMWGSYSNLIDGIMIESTAESLLESITNPELISYFESVNYENMAPTLSDRYITSYFKKRKIFAEEKEVRLIFTPFDTEIGEERRVRMHKSFNDVCCSQGINLTIDPEVLIKKIYLAPKMPETLINTIRTYVKNKSLSAEVKKSEIFNNPITE